MMRHAGSIRPTPTLSDHARERCAEMGISTKVAKAIARHGDTRYPGGPDDGPGRVVVKWTGQPDYAVVLAPCRDGGYVVVTVLFATTVEYDRAGATYVPRAAS